MSETFEYEVPADQPMSVAIVAAVALAYKEDVIEQNWLLSNDINPDALDKLFDNPNTIRGLSFHTDTSDIEIVIGDTKKVIVTPD